MQIRLGPDSHTWPPTRGKGGAVKGRSFENISAIIEELQKTGISVPEYLRQNPGCPIKQGCLYKHLQQAARHGSVLPDQRKTGKPRKKRVLSPMVLAVLWVLLQEVQASPVSAHHILTYLIISGPPLWRSFPMISQRTLEQVDRDFKTRNVDGFADQLPSARVAVGLAIDLCPVEPDDLWQGDAYEITGPKLRRLRLDAVTDQDGMPISLHVYHVVDAASGYLMPQHYTVGRRPDRLDVTLTIYKAVVPVTPALSTETGKPKILRLDRGGECRGFYRLGIAQKLEIEVQFTPRATPRLNSRVERVHRTIAALLRVLIRRNPDLVKITKYGRTISLPDFLALMDKAREIHNARPRRGRKLPPKQVFQAKRPRSENALRDDRCMFCAEVDCKVDYQGVLRLGSRRYASTNCLAGEKVKLRVAIHSGELYAVMLDSTGGTIDVVKPL